jgi:hypothetical protein
MRRVTHSREVHALIRNAAWVFVATVACMPAGPLRADIISVNFYGSTGTNGASVTGTTGVVTAGNWNNVTNVSSSGGSLSNLRNAAGTTLSGVNLSLTWLTNVGTGTTSSNPNWRNASITDISAFTQNRALYRGILDGSQAAAGRGQTQIQITNIPFSQYDVYVYHMFLASHDFDLYVNDLAAGAQIRVSPLDGSNAAADSWVLNNGVNNSNYSYFQSRSGSTLTILANNKASTSAPIAGFQIVAVPEPGMTVLLTSSVAGIGLWFAAQRRR